MVSAMNAEMKYRGPDEEGVWEDAQACMGMVRLSIIGLGNGHQPIANESQSIFLVCNGEIYNYAELRESLTLNGHRFALILT